MLFDLRLAHQMMTDTAERVKHALETVQEEGRKAQVWPCARARALMRRFTCSSVDECVENAEQEEARKGV